MLPQVWPDPATFRPFFPEAGPDPHNTQPPAFRSPWAAEPAHDVKTIETVLNSVTGETGGYRGGPDLVAFRQQAESLVSAVYSAGRSPVGTPDPGDEAGQRSPGSQGRAGNLQEDQERGYRYPAISPHQPAATHPSPHFHTPGSSYSDQAESAYCPAPAPPSPDTPTNLTRHEAKPDYANIPPLAPRFPSSNHNQIEESLLNNEIKPKNLSFQPDLPDHGSPDGPRDLTGDRFSNAGDAAQDERKISIDSDFTAHETTQVCDEHEPNVTESNGDLITNMTEQNGAKVTKDSHDGYEHRKNHLESVLSKMNKLDEEQQKSQNNDAESPVIKEKLKYDEGTKNNLVLPANMLEGVKNSKPKGDHKPIKLKIARGEVVANTALENECSNFDEVQSKEEKDTQHFVKNEMISSWALDKTSILALNERIQNDLQLKDKVSDIVGDDVLSIFASAVDEADNANDDNIENKNVVFLYYAVKNSTNLNLESFNKNELEPLSNLALSIPLLSNLCKFVLKDANLKEELQTKIGKEDYEYFEMVTNNSEEEGDEFLQDEAITPRIVRLYHTTRNIVLSEAFSKLESLYKKIEKILTSTESTDDLAYNVAIVRLKTLISAPWNQQVIAAEAMQFDFDFLHQVYTFWKKVICQRNKPEKKPKKLLKMKPLPVSASDTFDTFGRPKRSRRKRNDVVTYDEDVMQNCNIKSESNVKMEPQDDNRPLEGTEGIFFSK